MTIAYRKQFHVHMPHHPMNVTVRIVNFVAELPQHFFAYFTRSVKLVSLLAIALDQLG